MILRYERIKLVLCMVLCFCLIGFTCAAGDSSAMAFQSVFSRVNSASSQGADVITGASPDEEVLLINGYGGGGYVSFADYNTPSDISIIMEQAEEMYKSFKKTGDIKETNLGPTSTTTSFGVVDVNNITDESINIKSLLDSAPAFGEITKSKPYILIYHTHSTEGYELLDKGWYSDDYVSRTEDTSKNIVRVGDELTIALEKAGFNVIHDRNIYDKSYNGAYDRSAVMVDEYLKKYPSIVLTLDVHRDAIHYDDGTKCKPTATIDGKKAAQVMIITGCEGDGVSGFPRWADNLRFALHLQNSVEEKYEGLMRPVFFCNRKYNMNKTPCSLLLEFGTDANTLEEAVYSAGMIGECLGDLLNKSLG